MSVASYRMCLFVPDGCKHKGMRVNVALSLGLLAALRELSGGKCLSVWENSNFKSTKKSVAELDRLHEGGRREDMPFRDSSPVFSAAGPSL